MVNAEMGDYWLNITQPCKLCRSESLPLTGEKYCVVCYKEILTNTMIYEM